MLLNVLVFKGLRARAAMVILVRQIFLKRLQASLKAYDSDPYVLSSFLISPCVQDYALGMELTMNRWKCRYVEEYLAIGEAPEQLRNCFQQRSRWCKVCALLIIS